MSNNPSPAREGLAEAIAELVACASVEMTAHRLADAQALASALPAGTRVYVNHLPRHTLATTLTALQAVHRAGLEPVPHFAARRLRRRDEAQAFLQHAVAEAGVQKVLLIGGDDPTPAGPFADSTALLRDGLLAECGVREVGIAGYPEGHPRIPRPALDQALAEKLALAAQQGLGAYILTQFSFAPLRVVEYCAELAHRAPGIPVYVGIAGPTEPITLLRYAQRCGVSASLRALRNEGINFVRLVTHTDPGDQLVALARYCRAHPGCNVVGTHFYSFGGAAATAAWMNRMIARQGAPA